MENELYFGWTIDKPQALIQTLNAPIVVLSFLIAVLAGFCVINLILFFTTDKTRKHNGLKILGGGILGLGIWSTHFISMLALSLPVSINYNIPITIMSIIPAIIGATLTLHLTDKPDVSLTRLIGSGLVLTLGITVMHLSGMAAMSVKAYAIRDPLIFTTSIIASWALTCLMLFVVFKKFRFKKLKSNTRASVVLGAILFGLAVAIMHYTELEATYFFEHDARSVKGISTDVLAYTVLISIIMLMCTFTLIIFYMRRTIILAELASSKQRIILDTIDHMQDPFLLCNRRGKVLLMNNSYKQTFQLISPDVIQVGQPIEVIMAYLESDFFIYRDSNEKDECINRINKHKNCQINTIDGQCWLLRQNTTPSGHLIQTWTNITEQVLHENLLTDARNEACDSLKVLQDTQQELVETKKLASLGGLVSSVAHELNTPIGVAITSLSAIHDYTKDALANIDENSEDPQSSLNNVKRSLSPITDFESLAMRNLDRAAKIIEQFKIISVDQQIEEAKEFNLADSIANRKRLLLNLVNNHQISLHIDIDDNIEAFTYENALFHVVEILVSNSIEHGFNHQQAGDISISATLQNERIKIFYDDNGDGIDPKVAEKMFEPFVTTKRSQGKIGLGLHIAFNFVRFKLLGTIKNINSASRGSHFVIEIPVDASNIPAII